MNQKDSRHVLLPLSNSLKSTGKSAHCRYGNELNQTDNIAHQPDSDYHCRSYVWDHTHKRRSGLSVQKGGSISGPLFLFLINPNFVVFQFHQGERIPAHVRAHIQSSWLYLCISGCVAAACRQRD
ncbi:hypothetical protein [Escherichia coli]|uniref:hypothetical protein n=1 Tax=Escherichia coli TaxID=562 RepID=UPI0023B9F5F9|nr:hypothetical protein [Escherichia coli]MDT8586026.1 hypothetical protein [Escherichia coli]